jgi:hypothetical protein
MLLLKTIYLKEICFTLAGIPCGLDVLVELIQGYLKVKSCELCTQKGEILYWIPEKCEMQCLDCGLPPLPHECILCQSIYFVHWSWISFPDSNHPVPFCAHHNPFTLYSLPFLCSIPGCSRCSLVALEYGNLCHVHFYQNFDLYKDQKKKYFASFPTTPQLTEKWLRWKNLHIQTAYVCKELINSS